MSKHICDEKCIYYPTYPSSIIDEYIDNFGLKHREAVYLCNFDDHRIEMFCKCKHYKTISKE